LESLAADPTMASYGAMPGNQQAEAKSSRVRINFWPILLAFIVPWGIFAGLLWARSFALQYSNPMLCNLLTAGVIVFFACLFCLWVDKMHRERVTANIEPSWLFFVCTTSAVATVLATLIGEYNYQVNMAPYYDINNLGTYMDIDPNTARGQALMDVGKMVFMEGSHVDLDLSMGFKSDDTYCVAPIARHTKSNSSGLAIYDFWAVGTNCCSGSHGGDFHCGQYHDPRVHGGVRLLNDGDRPYYRLAVQQAEAAFGIKAVHPIFLYWITDPIAEVQAYKVGGKSLYKKAILIYLCVQLALVLLLLLGISKMKWL